MAGRFIKLYDKILGWEWYSDINTFRLFVHLLLKANYKDLNFEGRKIMRGQLVTSLASLSAQTGLSVHQVRVSLEHLKMTGEVTSSSFSKYRVITIARYDDYQSNDKVDDKQVAGNVTIKRQADGKQMASKWQADGKQVATSIENIEQIEDIEKVEQIDRVRKTASRFTQPTKEDIFDFCMDENISIDVDKFYNHYEANGWMVGKNKMKDWKAAVRYWANNDFSSQKQQAPVKKVSAQQYTQRTDDPDAEAWARQMEMIRRAQNG